MNHDKTHVRYNSLVKNYLSCWDPVGPSFQKILDLRQRHKNKGVWHKLVIQGARWGAGPPFSHGQGLAGLKAGLVIRFLRIYSSICTLYTVRVGISTYRSPLYMYILYTVQQELVNFLKYGIADIFGSTLFCQILQWLKILNDNKIYLFS